jgi:hypothetical protein
VAREPNIPNLDGLVALGTREGVDIKPTLLRVMTDLYMQKPVHSPEEERHYTKLALDLIERVDAQSRAAALERLWNYPAAPVPVIQRLMRDKATRDDATPSPAANTAPAAPTALPAESFAGGKVAADELTELFFAASADERRLILFNLPYAALPPAEPIASAAAGDAVRRLEAAALSHHSEGFAQELERTLGISHPQARRLIDDQSGEPLVVVASVLGMKADVLQRILLCLNPVISQSVQRVYDLTTLYEEIAPEASLRMLAIWRAGHKAEPRVAAHEPHYWHVDSGERAPPVARPKIRWDEHAAHKTEAG